MMVFCTYLRWNKFLHDLKVVEVGCGLKHTVFLLDDGTMCSCGNNEKGQLGQDSATTRSADSGCNKKMCMVVIEVYQKMYTHLCRDVVTMYTIPMLIS